MRSVFDSLPPRDVLAAMVRETKEPVETIQRLSGFLIDPSAGFLTQHQKNVAYQIYQNVQHLSYILSEIEKYQRQIRRDSDSGGVDF